MKNKLLYILSNYQLRKEVDSMFITFTREELRELLEVTEVNLKNIIKRKQLEIKLQDKGYKLAKTYKVGRSTCYDLVIIEKINEGKTLADYQNEWKIRKKAEHEEYITDRIINEKSLKSSRTSILKANDKLKNIKWDTAKKWDEKLEQSNIIKKNGHVYFICYEDGRREECTRKEYAMYWSDNAWVTRALNDENNRFRKNPRNEDFHNEKIYELENHMKNTYGFIIRKYQSYVEAEEMKAFKEMLAKRNKE